MNSTETTPAEDFEIVHRGVLLIDYRGRQGSGARTIGDVGRYNGKLYARWECDPVDGVKTFGVREWSPGEDPKIHGRGGEPINWAAQLRQTAESNFRKWTPLEPTPADMELARFLEAWPNVSDMIGLTDPRKGFFRLFDPGPTLYGALPKGVTAAALSIDWRAVLARHVAGDWGRHGGYESGELSPGQLWALPFQPIAVQNAAAVASRSGPVRSSYDLEPADQAAMPRRFDGAPQTYVVNVLTVLGGRSRTLMTIGPIDT